MKLTEKDLLEWCRELPTPLLKYFHFKPTSLSREQWEQSDEVVFERNGETKILKSRGI